MYNSVPVKYSLGSTVSGGLNNRCALNLISHLNKFSNDILILSTFYKINIVH